MEFENEGSAREAVTLNGIPAALVPQHPAGTVRLMVVSWHLLSCCCSTPVFPAYAVQRQHRLMLFLLFLPFLSACACLLSDRHLTGPSAPCTPRTPLRGTLAPTSLHGTLRAPDPMTTLPLATGTPVRLASDSLTGTGRLPGAGAAGMPAGRARPARRRLRVTRKQQHGHCCAWPCSLCKLPQHVTCNLSDGLLLSAASGQSLQLLLACDAFIHV